MPLSTAQQKVADSPIRFRCVVAGRRFGKTHLAIRELCYHARHPNKEVWYVAPTYRQAKQIVWRKLKNRINDLRWAKKINEAELTITLKNNSVISLKGADGGGDNLRGIGLDFLCMDEFADIDQEAWYEVLRPTLADKQGKALFIGTPKGMGNWAHDIYTQAIDNPEQWESFQFTTIEGGNVKTEEIEAAKKDLDERTFRQEFMATFETYAGRIYYSFDRKENTIPPTEINLSVLYVGMDFNIDPMSAVIAVRQGDSLYVIDEIRMFSSNTSEIVEEIKSRYPNSKIWVYPDPAGSARKSSAGGITDHTILSNAGFIVKSPRSHTPVRDRINAVNSRLCDAKSTRHLFIHPKCKATIEGLERHTYKEGTTQPDKDSGYDHMMDALGYMVDYMFPIRKDVSVSEPQRWRHRLS